MRPITFYTLAACIFLPTSYAVVDDLSGHGPPVDVTNRYIIKFKSPSSAEMASTFIDDQGKNDKASKVEFHYRSVLPNTVAVTLPPAALDNLKKKHGEHIEYVEPDRVAKATTITTVAKPGSWGLPTTSNSAPAYNYQTKDSANDLVEVYVVDTGIEVNHSAFQKRAVMAYSAFSSKVDDNGHGTHVSGTIAATTWGIAPLANVMLKGVKVLDRSGSGGFSGIIAGLNYVANQKSTNPTRKMIVNMSLGAAGSYQPFTDAVTNLRNMGVVIVVAAGNENTDACLSTPSGIPAVLAIGATDSNNAKASYSNWGSCVFLNAPGSSITSLFITKPFRNNYTRVLSGTSMSAPHVAGVSALLMSVNGISSPDDVKAKLADIARKGVVTGATGSTTKDLLFNGYNLPL
jgi:subtilisin family serine protease